MKNTVKLKQENLNVLSHRVKTPSYNRDKVTTSIVHIGIGNFHRSHQAYFTNELMEQYGVLDCGICGIGLLDFDRRIYNTLKNQDGLYTLMVKGFDGAIEAKIIGSIVECIFAPENPIVVIEKMADPDIKIISLTITEGGYNLNVGTGKFDFTNPLVVEDMNNSMSPKTVFGYLTQAIKLRQQRGVGGFTIQSCDNIQSNGDVAKKSLLSYVEKAEPELIPWIEEHLAFPNAMVDRITPVTVDTDIDKLNNDFSIEDQWPVVCEPFIQWVIEDNFIAGRPAWEKVDVQFVKHVEPFENMKLRLLNAGHSILGILGTIHGYTTIDEVARDDDFKKFLKNFFDNEASPTLGDLGTINIEEYKASLFNRFQNIYIKDLVSRICLESAAKIPIFLLSTIREQLKTGGNINNATFIIAAWCRYNDGVNENGKNYTIEDSMSEELIRVAARSHQEPMRFLEIESIFGDLAQDKRFTDAFLTSLKMIRNQKIKDCVKTMN